MDSVTWIVPGHADDFWNVWDRNIHLPAVWSAYTHKNTSQEPEAAIKIPEEDKIKEFQAAIASKHPVLNGVWCTMDGLKLYLEQAGNVLIQERFYNGWKCDHFVSGVFVFCPDGTIPIAAYNYPGCFHDSTIAAWGRIYNKLEGVFRSVNGKCTVDSAFGKVNHQFLVKSGRTDFMNGHEIEVNWEATKMRQSAEWGMRALQASFPRLKDRLIYEEKGERKMILKMLILLYNFRARRVGINQILSTYMPHLQANANMQFVAPMVNR
jgi:DDE superfamily endonuclease